MSDSTTQIESDALWVKDEENFSSLDESADSNLLNKWCL
jgi:hypothetical protein